MPSREERIGSLLQQGILFFARIIPFPASSLVAAIGAAVLTKILQDYHYVFEPSRNHFVLSNSCIFIGTIYFIYDHRSPNNHNIAETQKGKISTELLGLENLKTLPMKYDSKKVKAIRIGFTFDEVENVFGSPSDKGEEHPVIQDALRGRYEVMPNSVYYVRYRYADDTLVIMLFNKESDRLIHFVVRSWTSRGPFF
jgi:hypothetical protein